MSGDILVIESRRGKISATTRVDEGMQKGVVMMPFSFLICCVYILFKFRTTLPFSVAAKILEKLEYVIKYDFV